MPTQRDFPAVFERLKQILEPFAADLVVKIDEPGNYQLDTHFNEQYRKALSFGAVQIKKNYVSFHLVPIYIFPDLLEKLPERLEKRMQGKACFNFTSVDSEVFDELAHLAERSFDRVKLEFFKHPEQK